MDRVIERSEWAAELDSLSAGNMGRLTEIEVDDPELGAQEQESGLKLLGMTYDDRKDRIEIMLGEPGSTSSHLTHSIEGATRLEVLTGAADRVEVVRIGHNGGQTLIKFN